MALTWLVGGCLQEVSWTTGPSPNCASMHLPRLHGAPCGTMGALLHAEIVRLGLKLKPVQAEAFAVVCIGFCGASLERHSPLATLAIMERLPEPSDETFHCCQLSVALHLRR